MLAVKKDLILMELAEGTGAAITAEVTHRERRSGMRIWFGDLDQRHGPISELRPHGLWGYKITLSFGNFSGDILTQIRNAGPEDVQLSRALVSSISEEISLDISGQNKSDWLVKDGSFKMTAILRAQEPRDEDDALIAACREVIVPMMAAMAELIGYDTIELHSQTGAPAYEGALSYAVVRRRERNPRNRLLCIRLHGERCFACGDEPVKRYGSAGSILEVHHLEPLNLLSAPRIYDPLTDLVPLCPNCHRAAHTRRPVPLSMEELQHLLGSSDG